MGVNGVWINTMLILSAEIFAVCPVQEGPGSCRWYGDVCDPEVWGQEDAVWLAGGHFQTPEQTVSSQAEVLNK